MEGMQEFGRGALLHYSIFFFFYKSELCSKEPPGRD